MEVVVMFLHEFIGVERKHACQPALCEFAHVVSSFQVLEILALCVEGHALVHRTEIAEVVTLLQVVQQVFIVITVLAAQAAHWVHG